MTTPQQGHEKSLAAEKMEAEVREAEARLKVLQAQAEARKAKEEMDEISGLTARKERVKRDIANMKQQAAADYAATKRTVEHGIKELQTEIERVSERNREFDAAGERRFHARLDEAEARLKTWKAQTDQRQAERAMKRHDELETLEERISLARARAAEASRERHNQKAHAAMEEAARNFDRAYDAAAKRYEKT